jgi:hypothetical protein
VPTATIIGPATFAPRPLPVVLRPIAETKIEMPQEDPEMVLGSGTFVRLISAVVLIES